MRAACLVLLVWALVACGNLGRLRDDLRTAADMMHVDGAVSARAWSGAPLVVAILRAPSVDGLPYAIVDYVELHEPGRFAFLLQPDPHYRLVAFEDANHDLAFAAEERVVAWSDFADLPEAQQLSATLVIERALPSPDAAPPLADPTGASRHLYVGDVISLADPRFDPAVAQQGVWQPVRFLTELGAGIFQLAPHEPTRTPVLFVHGMSGTPRQFEPLVARLDATRFEPWLAHYPSGWDLASIASDLHRALDELVETTHAERVCIVAHSMGGLVIRRAMNLYSRTHSRPYARELVTIASPLGGIQSAATGVAVSPVVVPAWRALATTSEYVHQLYELPLPDETRYALFFAFGGHDGTDGAVPLESQLRAESQAEADLVRGFDAQHTAILADEAAIAATLAELERCLIN